jgi:uncharacterized protein (DUF488 family)
MHEITALGDVRSTPASRYAPQFNESELKDTLRKTGIAYVSLGAQLGARSRDQSCYKDGRVQYSLLAQTAAFSEGLTRVIDGAQRFRIALCCAEKEPLDCHRTILIARHLTAAGIDVKHILLDGSVESHASVLNRLLQQFDMRADSLFSTYEEIIADAYQRQEHRIAYRVKSVED